MIDLKEILQEIDQKASGQFISIFKQVQIEFQQIFSRLFEGGVASIVLLDQNKPLESGIDIQIRPPGKQFQSIHLFSGGEKVIDCHCIDVFIFSHQALSYLSTRRGGCSSRQRKTFVDCANC